MQVIFVPWLGGSHPIALICSVCRWKRRTRRSHVPVSIRKVLCVPGVLNLGSVQRIIDAIQVSQPFVLRARCWTYFQAGMLGHTLAFIAFVNTPQSWGRLLSWNRFPLMLWEWLAWRIFPRWHQQPMKYRGSISAVWPLQQGDLQEGQPRVSVFISLGPLTPEQGMKGSISWTCPLGNAVLVLIFLLYVNLMVDKSFLQNKKKRTFILVVERSLLALSSGTEQGYSPLCWALCQV